ncbi:MAG: class I SAM-dependent methyltransferase [Thermoguttaceae bacterium]
MELVKRHFDEEAKIFDETIVRLIPRYAEFTQTLVEGIAFDRDSKIDILDIGCGTGTIARKIADLFPNAKLTLMDIAPKMIQCAKHKLSDRPETEFVVSDFTGYDFSSDRFDVIVSSLALHHAETDDDKIDLYRRIFKSLRRNGQFLNFDVTLGPTDHLDRLYINKWVEFMKTNVPEDEVNNKWLKTYREEDRPVPIATHLKWLAEVGFTGIDVLLKQCLGAVYCGTKP